MEKRRIFTNALLSIIQVVVYSLVLFFLYRFLLRTIGIEKLGIWALVLSTTSMASIANLGISGSVVKFVAKYLARNQTDTVSRLVQTAAISMAIVMAIILFCIFPFARLILRFVMPEVNHAEAISILPFALLSLWFNLIGSVFQSALDGFQLIAQRCTVMIAATIFHLFFSFLLVPTYGLIGLAFSHIVQAGIVVVLCWVLLKRNLPLLPFVPYQWDHNLFREMIGYGLNFQLISICQILRQPIITSLLSKFGGLALTGYYDMANRMTVNLRWLILSANQVLVPAIAHLHEKDPKAIRNVYKEIYRLNFFIAIPFFSVLIFLTPLISKIWIGYFENSFIYFFILLLVAWFFNVLSLPAYTVNLGIGKLRWNSIGYLLITILTFILGILFGRNIGGGAIVAASALALIVGSLVIVLSYHFENRTLIHELIPEESIRIFLICIFGILIFSFTYLLLAQSELSYLYLGSLVTLSFFVIVGFNIWRHPMRKRLYGWISNERFKA